ncbi:M23 family metallopeptidase [Microbacterium enclense]|uniref:M23 family metallopeptidase n=1 Tax=Microbacterium enclense TaxID=993073 RepID=UPI0021A47EA9|nr:M23 family metallopeptidase [Microbacterium enclense]MCT2087445.1 M23 family metallopeptidase [Microbacterium enclense]
MTDIQNVTDDVPCGCGPTPEEARTLRGGITRRRALSASAIGVFLAATGASLAPSAFAAEYPTWDDVEKARNNEAAKGAEVTRIQGLIWSAGIRRAREAAAARAREEERRRREEERRRQAPNNVGAGGESSSSGGGGGKVQSSGWVRPAHGWISSWFGTRGSICRNGYCTRAGHRGIDFASSCGSPIYAAYPGTVIFAGYSGAWGNYIKIQHADGTVTGYAHIINGGYNVNYGQRVRAGQVIAYIGSTGASSGCHLHFEVYVGGVRVDPAPFLRARGVAV